LLPVTVLMITAMFSYPTSTAYPRYGVFTLLCNESFSCVANILEYAEYICRTKQSLCALK